jgi:23S rRNA (uracil1939-C5)-methyltransferase
MTDLLELVIEKTIYNGYSLCRHNGIVIFTRWGVPGDKVKVKILEKKRNYYLGEIVSTLEKSSNHTTPLCRYFSICGGCHIQNMTYETQLKEKQNIVKESAARFKSTQNIDIRIIIPSIKQINYRNKAQLPYDKNKKIFGFYKLNSHEIVHIKDGCKIQDEMIDENIKILNNIEKSEEYWDHILHIVFRKENDGIFLIIIMDRKYDNLSFIKYIKNLKGVYLNINTLDGNKIFGDEYIHINGERFMTVNYFDESFILYPWLFLQVNSSMTEKLYTDAIQALDIDKNSKVIDGYCGIGITSILIARKVKKVISIEYDPMSIVSLGMNANSKDVSNIKSYQGDIEEILIRNRAIKGNKILIDPPKKGLTRETIKELLRRNPEKIVYISCNPQTLMRDIDTILKSGQYECEYIQPYDLFPQTFHMENIAVISKK